MPSKLDFQNFHGELSDLMWQYADIFRLRMGSDPPVSVAPIKVRLKPGAKPFRAKLRRYSSPQAASMRNFVHEYLKLGLIYRNNDSA